MIIQLNHVWCIIESYFCFIFFLELGFHCATDFVKQRKFYCTITMQHNTTKFWFYYIAKLVAQQIMILLSNNKTRKNEIVISFWLKKKLANSVWVHKVKRGKREMRKEGEWKGKGEENEHRKSGKW